jgi:hypothetical protein
MQIEGDTACVKLLLAHADNEESPDLPDARRLVNSVNLTGLTPAHFACWRGHGGVLRDLVNAGAYLAVGGWQEGRAVARNPRGTAAFGVPMLPARFRAPG